MGRPTKYTPETVKSMCSLIAAGNAIRVACGLSDIDPKTHYIWMEQHPEYFAQIKKAESAAVAKRISLMTKSAENGSWQAAAWWLERTMPELYGRQITIKSDDGKMDEFIAGMNKIINGDK